MRLHESGQFYDEIDEILDMIFASPLYEKQDLLKWFDMKKEEALGLFQEHLSNDERVKLFEAIRIRVNKLKNKQTSEQLQQKETQDDPVDPEETEEDSEKTADVGK